MKTVSALVDTFLLVLDQAVKSGRSQPATRGYYFWQLQHLKRHAGEKDPSALIPEDLGACPYTYHFAAAVRRLFKWASDAAHVPANRFANFVGPVKGQRNRVLTEAEFRRLMRHAGPALRKILWFLKYTIARPGELRGLRWNDVDLGTCMLRLGRFKCRDRRRDGVLVRKIPLTTPPARLLGYWKGRLNPPPGNHVFVNSDGRPWTGPALRLAMHRAGNSAGLNGPGRERVVCYTLRHTSATDVTFNGMPQLVLAKVMGHTNVMTTQRYQHVEENQLVSEMEKAQRPKKKRRGKAG